MNPETAPSALPFLLEAVVGGALGAFIAVAASFFLKRAMSLLPDMLLGAVGFIGGVFLTPHIPWHLNTVTSRVGDSVIRTTSRHYQYPYRVAFLLGILLPLVLEAVRLLIQRNRKPVTS